MTKPKLRALQTQWAIVDENDNVVSALRTRKQAREEIRWYKTIIGSNHRLCKVKILEVLQ